MEITKKAFSFLLSILPVLLITGPAIPDIVITFSAVFLIILMFWEKYWFQIKSLSWLRVSIIFWIFCLFPNRIGIAIPSSKAISAAFKIL